VRKYGDFGIENGKNEWRCFGVGAIVFDSKTGVIVRDNRADNGERDDVKDRDTPKDLFACSRN